MTESYKEYLQRKGQTNPTTSPTVEYTDYTKLGINPPTNTYQSPSTFSTITGTNIANNNGYQFYPPTNNYASPYDRSYLSNTNEEVITQTKTTVVEQVVNSTTYAPNSIGSPIIGLSTPVVNPNFTSTMNSTTHTTNANLNNNQGYFSRLQTTERQAVPSPNSTSQIRIGTPMNVAGGVATNSTSQVRIGPPLNLGGTTTNTNSTSQIRIGAPQVTGTSTVIRPQSPITGQSQYKDGEVIKGNSRIEYIPFQTKVIDYEDREIVERIPVKKQVVEYVERKIVQTVPRDVVTTDYYAVEHIKEYIPQVVPEKIVEVIPVERIVERTEYVPIETQIVHYPPEAGKVNGQSRILYQGPPTTSSTAHIAGQSRILYSSPSVPVVNSTQNLASRITYQNHPAPGAIVGTSRIVANRPISPSAIRVENIRDNRFMTSNVGQVVRGQSPILTSQVIRSQSPIAVSNIYTGPQFAGAPYVNQSGVPTYPVYNPGNYPEAQSPRAGIKRTVGPYQ